MLSLLNLTANAYAAAVKERLGRGERHARLIYREWYRTGRVKAEDPAFGTAQTLLQAILSAVTVAFRRPSIFFQKSPLSSATRATSAHYPILRLVYFQCSASRFVRSSYHRFPYGPQALLPFIPTRRSACHVTSTPSSLPFAPLSTPPELQVRNADSHLAPWPSRRRWSSAWASEPRSRRLSRNPALINPRRSRRSRMSSRT